MAKLPADWGNPTVVPNLVAEHIVNTSSGLTIDKQYLADSISEITVETQTLGAALLQITVDDPRWVIQRSGLCDKDEDGRLLQRADVNFPEGTDVWWRLAMVEGHGDPSQANLTLTFQHRVIAYLMQCYGPLGWPHGRVGSTRAQFVKYLMDKMPAELPSSLRGPGSNTIKFVCPELNEIQPVASSNVFGTEVVTAASAAAQQAGVNKLPGLTAATKVTIAGSRPNAAQIQNINTLLGVGQSLNAPPAAMVAIIYAATWESKITAISKPNSAGYWGVLQGSTKNWPDPSDVTGMATSFFNGGKGFQGGGAIHLAKNGVTNPIQIAVEVEVPSIWPDNAYAREGGYPGDAAATAEAQAIVNAFNGGLSGINAQPQSDVSQLTRGTPDNPDEDSWTCSQRIASEVNWMLFSSPQPHPGQWGNYIYFMDGVTAVAQRPSLYIKLSDDGTLWTVTDPTTGKVLSGDSDGMLVNPPQYTVDNTAYQYEVTKASAAAAGKHGPKKVTKKTRIQTPQTPSQALFSLLAGVMEFNAGDVFVFHDAGSLNGRWIVEDVTHNTLGDLFAQFTLGPPVYAYPEPQSGTVTVLGTNGQPVTVATGANSGNGSVPSGVNISGYVNPLKQIGNLSPGRIDMGVDYSGSGPILALGDGQIVFASNTDGGWPGGGCVVYKLSNGPFAGKYVYAAENITVTAQLLQNIKAGQQIATLRDAMPNLEMGWASGNGGQPLAGALGQQNPGDPGGWSTACGRNFNELLTALGAPSGVLQPNPPNQSMPLAWPTLGQTSRTTKPLTSPLPVKDGQQAPPILPNVTAGVPGGMFASIFGPDFTG